MLLLFLILVVCVLVLLGAAVAIRSVILSHNRQPELAKQEEEISNQF